VIALAEIKPRRKRSRSRAVYVVRLRARPGDGGVRALRQLLKVLLRHHQLRCVSVREESAA
jgi:hypothetical protein